MGILEGKNILVAGVTLDTSIGFHVAKIAQAEGAKVVVSNFGRAMSLTARVIKKLDPVPLLRLVGGALALLLLVAAAGAVLAWWSRRTVDVPDPPP